MSHEDISTKANSDTDVLDNVEVVENLLNLLRRTGLLADLTNFEGCLIS